jgi:hypothetical protein
MSDKMPTVKAGTVKKTQLKKLVDNYYRIMKKVGEDGVVVNLDRKTDAQSVWFPKSVIDQMFATHGCTEKNNDEYGLRIYFAVHEWGVLEHDEIPGNYHNQQTAILVPTKNINGQRDRDLLKDDEHLTRGADGKGDGDTDGDGMGVNHGVLCPPDTGCGCAID